MTEQQLKDRTKRLALDVIGFVADLPNTRTADVLGKQLLRSGTSVGANYRSACRGRSDAEMAAKLGVVEEEADESQYWLELIIESGTAQRQDVQPLWNELEEVISIMVSSRRTIRTRIARTGSKTR